MTVRDRIGGCESEIYRLVRRNRWFPKRTIIGTFPGNDLGKGDRVYILAEYSTEEKAIKAMEMCRKKYADSEFNRSVLCGMGTQIGMMPDNIVEVFKDGICDNFTFRFPEDEEVD